MIPAEIPFFLLAGGLGTRARPLSDYKPKPLFPMAGRPLIEIMSDQLRALGSRRGFVNLHHHGEHIRKALSHREGLHFFYEESLSGSNILKEAAPHIKEMLLVVNGDIFTEIPLHEMVSLLRTKKCDGVLLVKKTSEKQYAPLVLSGARFLGRKKDMSLSEEFVLHDGFNWMYTGVALFTKRVLEAIAHVSFFDTLAGGSFDISVIETTGPWWDLGTPYLYLQADAAYRKHIGSERDNSFSLNVKTGKGCSLVNSVIWENTTVGGRSSLSNCIVTGNMSLNDVNYRDKIITPDGVYDLHAQP